MSISLRSLSCAAIRNSFVDELPGEVAPDTQPRQVPGACYSQVDPTPVADPHLLAWSDELGTFLGLETPDERGQDVNILAGNAASPGMKPFAARYGGHQFGNWAGQLGDGRAISLGEVEARDGSWWELQLKGAGPTPFSRRGDGRAVLRSSLREFLCSEAMYHLGVPTTRALSLVATGNSVVRDMFYSGDAKPEPGAIVTRVAPTFIRFGNFQIMTAMGEQDNLRALADYTLRHHFPELGEPNEAAYLQWFEEVCRRTAVMIAHWMCVGFVHGVMNTDNMSILGLTIDYGPYGWLEPFEPDWTPNTTDFGYRRYAFGQQPQIAQWNLVRLAQALAPLVADVQDFGAGLERFRITFTETHQEMMLQKLGLTALDSEADAILVAGLLQALEACQSDMTLFFRQLSHLAAPLRDESGNQDVLFRDLIASTSYATSPGEGHEAMARWLVGYAHRLRQETAGGSAIGEKMRSVNPKYVPRNYLAQQAIEAADAGDLSVLQRLMHVLQSPFEEHPGHEELAAKRPEWARTRPGCATLSCSS
jgi:serine/tyrosine/threonine adenylyltransferase